MKIVQMVRYVTAIAQSYIGPVGQLVVDLGSKNIRVQDGATLGGFSTMSANNNLSDLQDFAAARNNLQLGTAAIHAAGDFDAAGSAAAVLVSAEAYTDAETAARITAVAAEATTRGNADTTIAATVTAETAARIAADLLSAKKAANLSDLVSIPVSRTNLDVYSKSETDAKSFTNQASSIVSDSGVPTIIASHDGTGGGLVIVRGIDLITGQTFVDIVPYVQFNGYPGGGPFSFLTTDPSNHFGVRQYTGGGTASLYLSRTGGPVNVTISVKVTGLP